MPVLRQHHEEDFTVIPNITIRDQRLSCRDLGLLVRMLQKPQDWKFTTKALAAELEQDGERSIQSGIKKLKELGYLEISREPRQKGKMQRSVWTVRDVPQLQNVVMAQSNTKEADRGSTCLEALASKKEKKREDASGGGGTQLSGYYYDTTLGEWRSCNNA